MEPEISIHAAAIRTEKWKDIYENVCQSTNVPFEIVYVGHIQPDFTLPDNFRYIYANVKPSQCNHIAILNTQTNCIFNIGDDIVFRDKALDILYQSFCEHTNDKVIITPRSSCRRIDHKNGRVIKKKSRSSKKIRFFGKYSDSYLKDNLFCPILPVGNMMRKDLYFQLGGIDSRFISSYWDLDIALRVYSIGGDIIFKKYANIVEIIKSGSLLDPAFTLHDEQLFYSLWCVMADDLVDHRYGPDNLIHYTKEDVRYKRVRVLKERSVNPIPFVDHNLYTESQGEKGKWN